MVLRSLRRRLVRLLFGPPKTIEHEFLSEKFVQVCSRQSVGVQNCRCFDCYCARTEEDIQRRILEEKAKRGATNSSESSNLPLPPQRPVDPDDPLYPPCQFDEKNICYWYYAREDYHVQPLLRELFGPDRLFWLKIYPNFPARRDRRYPRTVLYFPPNLTQAEEGAALYILEWGQMPPPGWPISDEK